MKILIVDDDRINGTILSRLLSRDGHEVVSASNGREGVSQFESERPDLILMDIRMPEMDGYEAARLIKVKSSDRFVPIIFLTAVTDEEGLVNCIDAGGDDFLTKPFNRTILQAKINAMRRIQDLDSKLRQQKKELEGHQENLQREMEVGNFLFNNIVRAGNLLDASCIKHSTTPMSLFNGDLIMASYNPAGGLHIMLGDFTGHGLSASVGALPLSELFYGMTAQGFSIGDLAEEINAKLHSVMPAWMFCAACLIEVDYRQKIITIWNGGLPEVLILDGKGEIVHRIISEHTPLGALPMTREDRRVEILEMQEDYRVLLYSDGLIEATNGKEEMFDSHRLEQVIESHKDSPDNVFDGILSAVDQFRGDAEQSDDISLLEVNCALAGDENASGKLSSRRKNIPPSAWDISFSFSAQTLKSVDPLPTVINSVMNLQAPSGHRERIYTILAELYSNALDHGLLKLDTETKKTPEGFIEYYAQRELRLADLEQGVIKLRLAHTPYDAEGDEGGGEIRIRMEDSGTGFDLDAIHSSLENNVGHGGRGIALVRSLCTELTYSDSGRIAEAVYAWTYQ